jgi:anti-anti-sigma factor
MKVKIAEDKKKKGFFRVSPHGDIDSDSYLDFRKLLSPVLKNSTRAVLLDLKNVDYISSSGLGVIFSVKKFMVENKGEFAMCNLQPQIVRLFDIIHALPKQSIFETAEEAERFLERSSGASERPSAGSKARSY